MFYKETKLISNLDWFTCETKTGCLVIFIIKILFFSHEDLVLKKCRLSFDFIIIIIRSECSSRIRFFGGSVCMIDKETKRQNDKETNKQRDSESGPATKYFSISGFHYFLPLNNLVYNAMHNFLTKLFRLISSLNSVEYEIGFDQKDSFSVFFSSKSSIYCLN